MAAVPPPVVILIAPEDPEPTTPVMVVPESTVNEEAAVPPKLTPVTPVKLVPVMVTTVPGFPDTGENEVIVGPALINVNDENVAVPPPVETLIRPVEPLATIADMVVGESTVKEAAAVLLKLTSVTPVKLVPVILTTVPVVPVSGVAALMVGAGRNTNPARLAVVVPSFTETFPLAPLATTATMVVGDNTVNDDAAVPPRVTLIIPVKLEPVMVIFMPVPAAVGENELIIGCAHVAPEINNATSTKYFLIIV
jgi:hypothetical protein